MKKITIIFIYIFVIFWFGCQSPKNIEGAYSAKKNINRFELFSDSTFVYQSMLQYGSSFINKYSDGTWKRTDNNSIVLNSRVKNNILPMHIKKSESDKNRIEVCENLIITQSPNMGYTDKDYCVIPHINDQNYLDLHPELSDEPVTIDLREMIGLNSDETNKHVMNILPVKRGSYCLSLDKPVKSIYFELGKYPKFLIKTGIQPTYYILRTEKVNMPIQSGELLTIDIALNDSLFSYRIFDNTKLKIKGNKLIFKDKEENNKTNRLYLNK